MGNANAASGSHAGRGGIGTLNEFQNHVHNFFHVPQKKTFHKASLEQAWSENGIDKTLQEKLSGFIFGSSSTGITYDKLMEKVKCFVLEDPSEMSLGLYQLLNQNYQLSQSSLRNYFSIILEILGRKLGNDWRSFHAEIKPSKHFISYVLEELPEKDFYDEPELESWLVKSPHVVKMQSEIFRRIFGIPREALFSLPIPMLPPNSEAPPTILEFWEMWTLTTWLRPPLCKKWRLLFSTRLHGESFSKLTSSILGQGPTLILIQVPNGIFGAFTSLSWKMSATFYGNEESFLFRLRPSIERFDPTGYNQNFQYLNTGQATLPNGLGVGGQLRYFGLFLSSDFGSVNVSKSCTTFKGYKDLAPNGAQELPLNTLEVWGVGERDPTPEEMGMRSSNKPRGMDGATEHLMEMAGRNWEGKEYRREVFKDQDNSD